MQCVVLCGGFGTRIHPLTNDIPKAMIDINGKPFIHHQLAKIITHGVDKILLNIGHLGYMIQDYIGFMFYGIPVSYSDEGNNLLGTAGAIKLALAENKLDDLFLVTYGDSYLPIDYSNPFCYCVDNNIDALMTIYKNNGDFDKSNVIIDNNNIIYDKKYLTRPQKDFNYIDYGLSVLSKNIIKDYVPENTKYGLADLFHKLSLDNKLKGYEVYDRFFEIGSFEGIKSFKDYINAKSTYSTRS